MQQRLGVESPTSDLKRHRPLGSDSFLWSRNYIEWRRTEGISLQYYTMSIPQLRWCPPRLSGSARRTICTHAELYLAGRENHATVR